jgi:general secretion pathway protein L
MRLQASIRLRQTSSIAIGWWLGELAALVPAVWRRRLSSTGGRLVIAIDGESLTVSHPDIGRSARSLRGFDGKVPNDIEAVLRRAARGALRVTLQLPARCGLSSRMRLPLAAEENLREAIGFELDRQTPFKAEAVFFTHRVAERDSAARRLLIELTVVPRAVVETALAVATGLGLAPDRVEVAAGPETAASSNLLPPGHGKARWQAARRLPASLAVVAVLLAAAIVIVPLYRAGSAADALRNAVDAARKDANAGLRLQGEIARVAEESQFLANRKSERPSVSEVLAELTRQLPDDAWLTDLHLAGDELQASGSAASATAIIERLDRSPLFVGAGFRSPVLRDAKLGRETFQIAMRIARGKGE